MFLTFDQIPEHEPLDGFKEVFDVVNSERQKNSSIDTLTILGRQGTPEEAKQESFTPLDSMINDALQADTPVEVTAQTLVDEQKKIMDMDEYSDYLLESALTQGNPNYSPAAARLVANQRIAMEAIGSKFESRSEAGWGRTVLDFLDYEILRYLPFGLYEDVVLEDEAEGLRLAQAAATMSPKEYTAFINTWVDERAAEGVFSEENLFAMASAYEQATNAGYSPEGRADQIFGLFELATLGASAISKGVRVATRAGEIGGVEAATEVAERVIKTEARNVPDVQAELIPRDLDPADTGAVRPNINRMEQIARENTLVQQIQSLYKSGTFGRMATPEQIEVASKKIVNDLQRTVSRPVIDQSIEEVGDLGAKQVSLTFGKMKDGAPFVSETNATKFAVSIREKGVPAEVVQTPDGYVVKVVEPLDTTRLADEADLSKDYGPIRTVLTNVFGSTRSVENEFTATLANMGESGRAAIQQVATPYLKKLEALPLESRTTLSTMWRDLRDGGDAAIKDGYSEMEFISKWKETHPKGTSPTETDIDGFYALKTLNDTSYFLQANRIAQRYMAKGFKTIDLGDNLIPARVVEGVDPSTTVLNPQTGRTNDLSYFPEGTTVWELESDLDGIQYVVNPKNVRSIQYEDVLGYNAGGRRVNPDARYFVTLGDRAIMTSFSTKQASKAVDQLKNIFEVIGVRTVDELTDELDEVLKTNNDWNPSIETTEDLVAFMKENNWDTSVDVSFKARDEKVGDGLFQGMDYADYVAAGNRRNDQVLMEYGGQKAFNYNPIKAVVDQLNSTAAEYSFRNYTYNAKVSWLKKAGFGKQVREGADINSLFSAVDPTELKGDKGRKLRTLHSIIQRRDGTKGDMHQKLSDFGGVAAEWIFDKTGKKLALDQLNVEGSLLNLGFRSAFGFFNVSQFMLQGSHALVVSAISPKFGPQAAVMTLPMRLAIKNGTPEAYQRVAKAMGMDAKDVEELADYMRTSGRMMIEADALEKGTGAGFGFTAWEGSNLRPSLTRKSMHSVASVAAKVDKAGLVFFDEGERLGRYTGIITAFLEYKNKFKGASALSDGARSWITRREQDLTLNMTTTARGAWQSGLMKVPTQWMTFSMRAMEALIVGRGLSGAERVRLGLMLGSMGGTTGLVVTPYLHDTIGEKMGLDPKSPAYTAVQYGWYDGLMTWMMQGITDSDIRTAMGSRLAPLTAFSDLSRKLSQDSTYEAMAGPSGEIVGGAIRAMWHGLGAFTSGNWETAQQDVTRVLRTPTGIDNVVKAAGIARNGVYRSKTGTTLPFEMNNFDAAIQAAGVTNYKVADYYHDQNQKFKYDKKVKAFSKTINQDFDVAIEMFKTDPVRAKAFLEEIEVRIASSNLSPYDQQRLRSGLLRDNRNTILSTQLWLMRQGNEMGVERVESLKGDSQ